MNRAKTTYLWGLAGIIAVGIFMSSCSQKSFSSADERIESALEDSLFTGAVFLAGSSDEILHQRAFGYASVFDAPGNRMQNPERMTTNHVFDLASLTKVLATTYAVMLLHDRGEIHVDDPVSVYLPSFKTVEKETITIRHLLTHTSGLAQWYPTFYVAENTQERLDFISSQPLMSPVGEQRNYSDIGFMVLSDVIVQITGQPFDQFVNRNIYQPIGLKSTLFNPGPDLPNLVSTSFGNQFERKMVLDDNFGYQIDVDNEWDNWRDYVLKGEVNDGNAFYTHQGVAGHAGLFSTAGDIHKLISVLMNNGKLNDHQFIDSETIDLFLTKDEFNNGLGWGMDFTSMEINSLPEDSFGHTGFTGTSIIASPGKNLILILLTNRQHVGVNEEGFYPDLGDLRADIADLFF